MLIALFGRLAAFHFAEGGLMPCSQNSLCTMSAIGHHLAGSVSINFAELVASFPI